MVELTNDTLVFRFPEVHDDAVVRVEFQRTLRIPDDGQDYPLPPGLGRFPVRHVDDHAERLPDGWRKHGGVMLPMYQAEALWLRFDSPQGYPFAIKVAAGKINAATGESWTDGLCRDPQNYLSVPGQPWLDGYVVSAGRIRQFIAMPLGEGYSAEEQLTGEAENGGLQIQVYPLRLEHYVPARWWRRLSLADADFAPNAAYCLEAPAMGLGAGGSMKQEVYRDRRPSSHWDQQRTSRCFVHLTNSLVWREVTGEAPPTRPPTARDYTAAGLPWFDYYDAECEALEGGAALKKLRSVRELGESKRSVPLPENESVETEKVVKLGPSAPRPVREGVF
jgi:hypothetical protein